MLAEKMGELKQAYEAAVVHKDFNTNLKKINKAIDALKLSNPEERVRKQLQINAEKKFSLEAQQEFNKTGNYTPPDPAKVDAYVEEGLKRWRQNHQSWS